MKIDSKKFVGMVKAVPFDEQNMLFKNHPDESHSWRESGAQRIADDVNSDDAVDVYNVLRERSREMVANIVNAVENTKSVKIDAPYRIYAEESLMNCYTNVLFRLLLSYQSAAVKFISQRSEYVNAMKNTPGTGDQADYYRWSGHAESRRQLARMTDMIAPHESHEQTVFLNDKEGWRE